MLLKKICIKQRIVLDQAVAKVSDRFIVVIPEEKSALQFAVVQINVEKDETFTYDLIGNKTTKKTLFEIKDVKNEGDEYVVEAEAWIPMSDDTSKYSIALLSSDTGKLYLPKRIVRKYFEEEKTGFFSEKNITKEDADAMVFKQKIEGQNLIPDQKVNLDDLPEGSEEEEEEGQE